MPGLDDVLERLVNDAGFRGRLAADPAGALAGYDLSSEDLALLASQVTDGAGPSGAVEARTSRASLVGFMSAFGDVAEALSPTTGDLEAGASEAAAADAIPTESISLNFEEIKISYALEPETTADDLNIYATEPGDAQASDEEVSLTYRKVEVEHVPAGVDDPPMSADLAAPGDDPTSQGDGDVDGRDFLVWQRSAAPPTDGSDVLTWDAGDGSDDAAKGDTAEPDALATPDGGGAEPTGPIADVLYSAGGNSAAEAPAGDSHAAPPAGQYVYGGVNWVEGAPPIADDGTSFEFPGAYGSAGSDPIDSPGSGGHVPLAGDWDGDTGSADGWVNVGQTELLLFDNTDIAESEIDGIAAQPDAGTSAPAAGFVPVVGDWNGDAATADGDVDGRDFLAWQRHIGQDAPDLGSPVLSVGDEGNESAGADSGGVLPQRDELGREGTADPEPVAVKLENVQITSYQLGVLDNNAAPDPGADDLLPGSPGSESET